MAFTTERLAMDIFLVSKPVKHVVDPGELGYQHVLSRDET